MIDNDISGRMVRAVFRENLGVETQRAIVLPMRMRRHR